MTLFLDKVNSAPLLNNDLPFELNQWISNTVDSLNEVISDIQSVLISISTVTLTTQTVDFNSLYIPTNAALTTFQLPTTTANNIGSIVKIAGQGAGGWILLTSAGQTIEIGDVGSSAGTSIASSSRYDSIEIILVATNTWTTLSTQTTGFVIV